MNDWIPAGLSAMESVLGTLVWVSLVGSVIAVVVWLLQLGTRKYFSAHFFHMIWLLVALRFVMFTTPESPTSLLNLFQQPANSVVEWKVPAADFGEIKWMVPPAVKQSRIREATSPARFNDNTKPGISLMQLVLIVWAIGFLWMAVHLIRQCRATALLADRAVANDSNRLHRILTEAKSHFPGCRHVVIRISNTVTSPAVAGLFRPVILLPDWCQRELTNEQLRMVITHELIHIGRHDIAVQLASHFIVMLHWFNPLVWMIRCQIDCWREMTCDQRLLKTLNADNDGLLKKRYGETILQIAAQFTNPSNLRQVQPGWMPEFIGRRKNLTVERIQMINRTPQSSAVAGISGIAILLMVLMTGFTSAQILSGPKVQTSGVELLPSGQQTGGAADQEIVEADAGAIDKQALLPPTFVTVKVQIYEGESDDVLECMKDVDSTEREIQFGFKKLDGNAADVVSNALKLKCQTITAGSICAGLNGIQMVWSQGTEVVQNDPQRPLFIGVSLKMTPKRHGDHLTVEMKFDETCMSHLMSHANGQSGLSVHRLNSGVTVSDAPHTSYLFTYSMIKEDSQDLQDKKATVLILTPMKSAAADVDNAIPELQQDIWAAWSPPGQYQNGDMEAIPDRQVSNTQHALQEWEPAQQVSYDVSRFEARKSDVVNFLAGLESLTIENPDPMPWTSDNTMLTSLSLGDRSGTVLKQLDELVASSKIRRVADKAPMNRHGDYLKTSVKPFKREGDLVCFIDVAMANTASDIGTVIGTDVYGDLILSQAIDQTIVQTTLKTKLGQSLLLCLEMPQREQQPNEDVTILLLTPSTEQYSD